VAVDVGLAHQLRRRVAVDRGFCIVVDHRRENQPEVQRASAPKPAATEGISRSMALWTVLMVARDSVRTVPDIVAIWE